MLPDGKTSHEDFQSKDGPCDLHEYHVLPDGRCVRHDAEEGRYWPTRLSGAYRLYNCGYDLRVVFLNGHLSSITMMGEREAE